MELGRGYQPLIPNERGWLWCETLELWLGTWNGSIRREPPTGTCDWLRFYDRALWRLLSDVDLIVVDRRDAPRRLRHCAVLGGGGDVLEQADSDEVLGKMKVSALLEALPGVGKVRAQQIMERLEIAPSRRLRGLGERQRKALLAEFDGE